MKRFLTFSHEEVAQIIHEHVRNAHQLTTTGYVRHVAPARRLPDMPEDSLGELKIEVKSFKDPA